MIVNGIHGVNHQEAFYTCDFKGSVKKVVLKNDSIEVEKEADIGVCANNLTSDGKNSIFVGGTDGIVRKIVF